MMKEAQGSYGMGPNFPHGLPEAQGPSWRKTGSNDPGLGPTGTALLCLGRCQCAPRNQKVRTKCTGLALFKAQKGREIQGRRANALSSPRLFSAGSAALGSFWNSPCSSSLRKQLGKGGAVDQCP